MLVRRFDTQSGKLLSGNEIRHSPLIIGSCECEVSNMKRNSFGRRRVLCSPSIQRVYRSMSGDGKHQKIGTHNGTFHCDEVLACYMLKQLPQYKNAEIIRTRDPSVLDTCDIVVDVGGVFDPTKHKYDHHQRSFSESMSTLSKDKSWVTKLSSAGLVYLYFGRDIISTILETEKSDQLTETVFDKMYENFVEEIDGVDNGVDQFDGTPRYKITTTVSARVGSLNPSWNEPEVNVEERFNEAMKLVGGMFTDKIKHYKNSWIPARDVVETAIKKRMEVDSSGEIISLAAGGCPWKEHLFELEQTLEVTPPIKYVLYSDQSGKWRLQCVPVSVSSFKNRLSILEEWCGLRDEELSKKSGIANCIFVHANGFIGGNENYEGVLAMAKRSLQQQKQ